MLHAAKNSLEVMSFGIRSRIDPLNPVDTALLPSSRWFHFRLEGVKGKLMFLHIPNTEMVRPFYSYDGEVISCEEQVVKPEPEIYRRLLDRYSLDPAETLFIDDRPVNLEAARTFGISTFLFRHREAQRSCDELRKMLL